MTVTAAPLRRPTPVDIVRTFSIQGVLVCAMLMYVVLLGIPLLLARATFDRRQHWARRAARILFNPTVRTLCRIWGKGISLDASKLAGRPAGPAIVVSNHASAMDIVLLFLLPVGIGDGRVWAKGWPFRTPLLGQVMRLAGHLLVEDFNLLPNATSALAEGDTQLVFPQSSRSRDGRLSRFRDGAFLLAMRSGTPVIPVAIRGSFDCFPPGQMWIHATTIEVEVLGVLHPRDFASHSELKQRAYQMVAAGLEKAPAGAAGP